MERAFVKFESVYPNDGEEMSFEELRALSRGWMNKDWTPVAQNPMRPSSGNAMSPRKPLAFAEPADIENLSQSFQQKVEISDTSTQSLVGMPESNPAKQKRLKVREVKQETQTGKPSLRQQICVLIQTQLKQDWILLLDERSNVKAQ